MECTSTFPPRAQGSIRSPSEAPWRRWRKPSSSFSPWQRRRFVSSDDVTLRTSAELLNKIQPSNLPQQTKSHTAELRAKPEYHKFLIGKGGGNIRKVRDSTGARIIFPTAEDKDQELITVIGTEEAVRDAQKELEHLIQSLV